MVRGLLNFRIAVSLALRFSEFFSGCPCSRSVTKLKQIWSSPVLSLKSDEPDSAILGAENPRPEHGRLCGVCGAGGVLRLFLDVRLSQAVLCGDVRGRSGLGLRARLQGRLGHRPGHRLRPVQMDRRQGDRRGGRAGARPGHTDADWRVLAGAGGLRADPGAVECGGPVLQRSAAGPDLGSGLRLYGGTSGVRRIGRGAVRQLYPVVRRGEGGRQAAAQGGCQRSVDARSGRGGVHAAAAGLCLGPVATARAQRRG